MCNNILLIYFDKKVGNSIKQTNIDKLNRKD